MTSLSRKFSIYLVLIQFVFYTNANTYSDKLKGTKLRVVTAEVRRFHVPAALNIYLHTTVNQEYVFHPLKIRITNVTYTAHLYLIVPSNSRDFTEFVRSCCRLRGLIIPTSSFPFTSVRIHVISKLRFDY